jgi:hypothetical protein
MKYLKLSLIIIVTCCFVSCKEEQSSTINPLVKELFCFKPGSTWSYEGTAYKVGDIIRDVTLSVTTKSYQESQFEKHCNEKGRGYNFKEYISYEIEAKMLMSQTFSSEIMADECGVDHTANVHITTPIGSVLSFYCDEENNFSIPVEFLATYSYKNHKYDNVYIFYYSNAKYYVAKNVGFICCEKNYDTGARTEVWLVDKNVIQ